MCQAKNEKKNKQKTNKKKTNVPKSLSKHSTVMQKLIIGSKHEHLWVQKKHSHKKMHHA